MTDQELQVLVGAYEAEMERCKVTYDVVGFLAAKNKRNEALRLLGEGTSDEQERSQGKEDRQKGRVS